MRSLAEQWARVMTGIKVKSLSSEDLTNLWRFSLAGYCFVIRGTIYATR